MQLGLILQSQLLVHFSATLSIGLLVYQQLQARFHPEFNVKYAEDSVHKLIDYFYGHVSKNTASKNDHILLFSHKYSCGGGIVSTTAASLVSFPCAYDKLDSCCRKHDLCFETRLGQEACDEFFCNCLSSLEAEGGFCDLFAHIGLCMSTRLLGFWFYEHGQFNQSAFELFGIDDQRQLGSFITTGIETSLFPQ